VPRLRPGQQSQLAQCVMPAAATTISLAGVGGARRGGWGGVAPELSSSDVGTAQRLEPCEQVVARARCWGNGSGRLAAASGGTCQRWPTANRWRYRERRLEAASGGGQTGRGGLDQQPPSCGDCNRLAITSDGGGPKPGLFASAASNLKTLVPAQAGARG